MLIDMKNKSVQFCFNNNCVNKIVFVVRLHAKQYNSTFLQNVLLPVQG